VTPYAVLLVKPTDTDEVVRKAYHETARRDHPDANGGRPGPMWHTATAAYAAIKTAAARESWAKRQSALSGRCELCDGCGVRGTRMFGGRIRACDGCGGAGRR
jgi:hypothetical protein